MPHRVNITTSALRQIEELPRPVQRRIYRWLELLSDDPRRKPSRQLEGYPALRRVHASKDYVILYSILKDQLIVLVVRVGHRREIYRQL